MGVFYAVLAYLFWGIAPIYWKLLPDVSPLTLVAHRVVWSLPLLLLLIIGRKRVSAYAAVWGDWRCWRWHLFAAGLLAVNWFAFIWAVGQDRVLEVSFGYFLCPLLSVFLARVVERERLQPLQVAALACAAVGLGVMAWSAVDFPVGGLSMAVTWAAYGLLKKRSTLGALSSLGVETTFLLIPAILLLAVGGGFTGEVGERSGMPLNTSWLLLASTGLITTIPLLLFAEAAQRVSLSTMGVLQYLVPTCNFLIAVLIYREPFGANQLLAFGAIWIGLALYALGGRRRSPIPAVTDPV